MPHTMKFIKPFLDNKMSIFEEYGAFNSSTVKHLEKLSGICSLPLCKVVFIIFALVFG